MSKARLAKEPSMTQKDLATKVNEKPSVINDYESGRAVPNQQVLSKIERALGVKLRGKGQRRHLLCSFCSNVARRHRGSARAQEEGLARMRVQ
jgi:ribosome-binding protein aMBF1 (putative translation factor)